VLAAAWLTEDLVDGLEAQIHILELNMLQSLEWELEEMHGNDLI
jgi:hypothetical protein